jgi:hypothetical protein
MAAGPSWDLRWMTADGGLDGNADETQIAHRPRRNAGRSGANGIADVTTSTQPRRARR